MKGSKYGNIASLDSTSILGSTYINTLTKNKFGESTEENELYTEYNKKVSDITTVVVNSWKLSPYICDIVSYIAGYIVKGLKKCVVCSDCLAIIECDEVISLLQQRKQYGNLTRASYYVIKVCEEAERTIRVLKNSGSIFSKKHNTANFIINQTIRNLDESIYLVFNQHTLDEDFWNSHSIQLTRLILNKFVSLRLHHESNEISSVDNRIRNKLTKTILFKNQ